MLLCFLFSHFIKIVYLFHQNIYIFLPNWILPERSMYFSKLCLLPFHLTNYVFWAFLQYVGTLCLCTTETEVEFFHKGSVFDMHPFQRLCLKWQESTLLSHRFLQSIAWRWGDLAGHQGSSYKLSSMGEPCRAPYHAETWYFSPAERVSCHTGRKNSIIQVKIRKCPVYA